mmetsp:Transcript_26184/g.87723  ORF Transcript_26184/g.87723 Transcript_26184/m.87723 type:complete len:81 (-) Transcript_26184:76-318(-)
MHSFDTALYFALSLAHDEAAMRAIVDGAESRLVATLHCHGEPAAPGTVGGMLARVVPTAAAATLLVIAGAKRLGALRSWP